jgi:hypothetical protein
MGTFQYQQRREELKPFFDFADAEWLKIVHHASIRWLSLTSTVDRLIPNWLPIKCYFKSVNESPKILKNPLRDEDPEKECFFRHILIFFSNTGAVLFNLPKLLKLPILASWNARV